METSRMSQMCIRDSCYTPVDALQIMSISDIPHGEYWARSISHVASEGARLSVRQSACVAHTNGKRFVEAEGPDVYKRQCLF